MLHDDLADEVQSIKLGSSTSTSRSPSYQSATSSINPKEISISMYLHINYDLVFTLPKCCAHLFSCSSMLRSLIIVSPYVCAPSSLSSLISHHRVPSMLCSFVLTLTLSCGLFVFVKVLLVSRICNVISILSRMLPSQGKTSSYAFFVFVSHLLTALYFLFPVVLSTLHDCDQ